MFSPSVVNFVCVSSRERGEDDRPEVGNTRSYANSAQIPCILPYQWHFRVLFVAVHDLVMIGWLVVAQEISYCEAVIRKC